MSKRPVRLSRASAYYRLAAKADRAGNGVQATHYRRVADKLVDEERRDREHRAERARINAEWRARHPKL